MNNTLVSLFFGIGVGGWIYFQMNRRLNGGNPKAVWLSSIAAGAVAFFVFYSLFAWVFQF